MKPLPSKFARLVDVLDQPDYPGWSVGSAEGGWLAPSQKEWDKLASPTPPAPAPKTTAE